MEKSEILEEHSLDEQEWQHYCAYKIIEPQIRGCLDREKLLEQENQQLKQEVNDWKQRFISSEKRNEMLLQNSVTVNGLKNDKIKQLKQSQKQFAVDKLKKLKDFIDHNIEIENDIGALKLQEFYDNQIKELKGE